MSNLESERAVQRAELQTRLDSTVLPEAAGVGEADTEAHAGILQGAFLDTLLEFIKNQAPAFLPDKATVTKWVSDWVDEAFLQVPGYARLFKPIVKAAALQAVNKLYDQLAAQTPVEV